MHTILVPDKSNVLHRWIIKETVVNKYNPKMITYRVVLAKDRRLFTDIYVTKVYTKDNILHYDGVLGTGDGLNVAMGSFGMIRLD